MINYSIVKRSVNANFLAINQAMSRINQSKKEGKTSVDLNAPTTQEGGGDGPVVAVLLPVAVRTLEAAPCKDKSFDKYKDIENEKNEDYSTLFRNHSTIYLVNRVIINKKEGFCLEVTSFYLIFA